MTRDVRYDADSGRWLDRNVVLPPPGVPSFSQIAARIEALPVARVRDGVVYCQTCANGLGQDVEEDGTFGIRECECCGREVRSL